MAGIRSWRVPEDTGDGWEGTPTAAMKPRVRGQESVQGCSVGLTMADFLGDFRHAASPARVVSTLEASVEVGSTEAAVAGDGSPTEWQSKQ